MIKAAPPFSPAIYGNRHTLPKPMAEPAVASITPILLPNFALSCCDISIFSLICLQNYNYFLNFAPKLKIMIKKMCQIVDFNIKWMKK